MAVLLQKQGKAFKIPFSIAQIWVKYITKKDNNCGFCHIFEAINFKKQEKGKKRCGILIREIGPKHYRK